MKTTNFEDVGLFHEKFNLTHALIIVKPMLIHDELAQFRLRFLEEEMQELREGYATNDLAQIADALVDLVYVALGTAHLHGLPWNALWAEVQRANMTKERCEINHPYEAGFSGAMCCEQPEHKHSKRGNINDVIKPPGWRPPSIHNVLLAHGWPGHPLPMEPERV